MIGFGFSLSTGGNLVNAVTVELFDIGNVSLGSLSGGSAPDPGFTGGFFGVASMIAFLRAEVSFSGAAARFAFDNLRSVPVPEPSTLAILAVGLAGLGFVTRRRRIGVSKTKPAS